MRRYFFHSTLLHLAFFSALFLPLLLRPQTPIFWLEGFDFDGGGGGTGPGGGGVKKQQMGQVVPEPVKTPIPQKPAPVQRETKADETWKIKDAAVETPVQTKPTPAVPSLVERGEKEQKAQTNVVSRGIGKGEEEGTGGFDFGAGDGGVGKGVGIGIGPGSGGGGFGFGSYLRVLRSRIWEEWYQTSVFGKNKKCVVGLTVQQNGSITGITLEQPSDDPIYDSIAMRSVRNASPLPPLPPNFPRSNQRFRLQFRLID